MRKLIIVFMLLFIEVTFGSEQPVTVQGSPNWSSISLKATQSSVDKIGVILIVILSLLQNTSQN